MSKNRWGTFVAILFAMFLAGFSGDPSNVTASALQAGSVQTPRPDIDQVAKVSSVGVAATKKVVPGQNSAPVILFEERHDLRAVQVQEAIAMIRMHNQFGLRDIALEGYLKDAGPINTSWVSHVSGTQDANVRARAIVTLLREGEISSAEFIKLLYDDVELHALENRSEYEVSLSATGENAPYSYLFDIALKSMTPQLSVQVEKIDLQRKLLPKKSPAAAKLREKMLSTILSADPWAKAKYDLLNEGVKSQAATAEALLGLGQEIEQRARRESAQINAEDQAGMREYLAFWRGRIAASRTMADGISALARDQKVALIAAPIGAFHTEGMTGFLQQQSVPMAVLRPLAMENPKKAGALGGGFERKYAGSSVFEAGATKLFAGVFPPEVGKAHKKPIPVLEKEWFQAKSETYLLTDRIAHSLLAGGSGGPPPDGIRRGSAGHPPSGPPGGGIPPVGFSDDDLRGRRVRVDPSRIEIVPAAPGSKRRAVLFPIVLNAENPAMRKELWIKASLEREIGSRETAEKLLLDALQEIREEPVGERKKAEDAHGRIQITEDVHAVISETRKGALSVSLGM